MLLIIGLGLVSGVFIGRKILKDSIISSKSQKFDNFNNNQNLKQKISLTFSKAVKDYQNCATITFNRLVNIIDSIPYVVYKRLHSITGTIFVGGFIIVHFINNSIAYDPQKLNELSESLHKNPLLPILEIFGIYLPLFSHIVIGIILLSKGRVDLRIKSETNYRYIFQRISAYLILKTLLFHLITIRFNEYLPAKIRKIFNIPDKRDLAYQKVNIWFREPLSFIGYLVYSTFVTSVAYHLSNGLWTSAITWGLAKTYSKQVRLREISNIVFIILSIWGYFIIYLYSKELGDKQAK